MMYENNHLPVPPRSTMVERLPRSGDPTNKNQGAAKPVAVSEIQSPFTQSQLSLALSIAKSRPPDLSIRDYCLLLQKHIKQNNIPLREDRRFIDTPEFWKDQYSKLHREKVRLEGEVARLEHLVYQQCDNKPAPGQPCHSSDEMKEQEASMTELQEFSDLGLTQSLQSLDELESINCLMLLKRSPFLRRLIGDNAVPAEALLKAILPSISLLEHALSGIISFPGFRAQPAYERMKCQVVQSFKITAAVFNLCLAGLAHLCRDICGRRCKGQVVYALVKLFTTTLQRFHQLCSEELAALRPTALCQLHGRKTSGTQGSNMVSVLVRELPNFLVKLLTSLEFQEPNSPCLEVYEGLLASLIGRIGFLMSQSVFESPVANSKSPRKITTNSRRDAEMESQTINLEGRYLVYVLKTVMDRNEKDGHTLSKMLSGGKLINSNLDEEPLLTKTKQRLQETLLKGIFGQEGGNFINALKVPELDGGWENEVLPTNGEEGVTFVESVWSVIGWDLVLKP